VVTHDHLDHLDPETIQAYRHMEKTCLIGSRLACKKLAVLGVPSANIVRVDAGESVTVDGVQISGVYAVPSELDAILRVSHPIAQWKEPLPHIRHRFFRTAAPYTDLLVTCINGKDGNLNPQQAAKLAKAVAPAVAAIPHHYDMFALRLQ
jgi:L-ascorbate 6-phosphate lactonase